MATKNNPGKYDCYANADPNEPMFILLARDPFAPNLVTDWADQRQRELMIDIAFRRITDQEYIDKEKAKIDEARKCATFMREWRKEHRESCPAEPIKSI